MAKACLSADGTQTISSSGTPGTPGAQPVVIFTHHTAKVVVQSAVVADDRK